MAEPPVFADSDHDAIAALKRVFHKLPAAKDYSPTDIIMLKGPDSDVVVFTGTVGEMTK